MVDLPVPMNPMRIMFCCMLWRKVYLLNSIHEAVSDKDLPWTRN
jgi:hypothetical protein